MQSHLFTAVLYKKKSDSKKKSYPPPIFNEFIHLSVRILQRAKVQGLACRSYGAMDYWNSLIKYIVYRIYVRHVAVLITSFSI